MRIITTALGLLISEAILRNRQQTASQPQPTSNDPNCYMTFDGQNLGLYNNNGQVANLDAMSGQPDYQSAQYQNIARKGPITEENIRKKEKGLPFNK